MRDIYRLRHYADCKGRRLGTTSRQDATYVMYTGYRNDFPVPAEDLNPDTLITEVSLYSNLVEFVVDNPALDEEQVRALITEEQSREVLRRRAINKLTENELAALKLHILDICRTGDDLF